jgi:hypothetical protein
VELNRLVIEWLPLDPDHLVQTHLLPGRRYRKAGGLDLEQRLPVFTISDNLVLQVFFPDNLSLRYESHAAFVDAGFRQAHDLLPVFLHDIDEIGAGHPLQLPA